LLQWARQPEVREPAGPPVHPLAAIQANLEQHIPQLYRELALYLQVLREVLPSSLDQACAHLATQVHPRRYSRLPERVRQQLHGRLRRLLNGCRSLLTVEQLQNLASQMARESQPVSLREGAELSHNSEWPETGPSLQTESSHGDTGSAHDEDDGGFGDDDADDAEDDEDDEDEDDEDDGDDDDEDDGDTDTETDSSDAEAHSFPLPLGSIQLNLTSPLTAERWAWPAGLAAALLGSPDSGQAPDPPSDGDAEGEGEGEGELPPWAALLAEGLFAAGEPPPPPASLWSSGQLPRDPLLLIHWLEGLEVALNRRLRNLSHSVNMELMRAGLLPALIPVRLLDSVLTGQIESHGAPANLLHLPLLPHEAGRQLHAPLGVLLRTVDLEMEHPRLRTCRRRLLHHRQEILKMAESFHRLQRRLQAQHAERLWRHDSQLNPPQGT